MQTDRPVQVTTDPGKMFKCWKIMWSKVPDIHTLGGWQVLQWKTPGKAPCYVSYDVIR